MALRALMLRKKIITKRTELETLRGKDVEFEKREAELEVAINEAETEEEKEAVEAEVDTFETEKKDHKEKIKNLETEIEGLERDLEDEEAQQPPVSNPNENTNRSKGEIRTMETRKFYGMNMQERDAFFSNEGVKDFLEEVRTCIKEKRAISNVGLTIPEVMLPLLTQVIEETSKLLKHVNKQSVSGKSRQNIMGTIPEGIWTEMIGKLNELDLLFNMEEVDGYKVGGFFVVPNAVLEDNDVDLASKIIDAIGKAIGKALDKAIVFGKGNKMPMGFVTRLAQEQKPESYPAAAREWEDLHESNIITGKGATGLALFKEIVENTKVCANDYSADGITWIMNKKTHTDLLVNSMDKNMNAAIVAGINTEMPVVGGIIEELSFMPDGAIAFGYLDLYLLAERAGVELGQSEHVKFIEDQTVFKGTARYDGTPVIAEAFGYMSITSTAPETTVTFPTDTAN